MAKTKLILEVSDVLVTRMNRLQEAAGLANSAQVISRALAIYEFCLTEKFRDNPPMIKQNGKYVEIQLEPE